MSFHASAAYAVDPSIDREELWRVSLLGFNPVELKPVNVGSGTDVAGLLGLDDATLDDWVVVNDFSDAKATVEASAGFQAGSVSFDGGALQPKNDSTDFAFSDVAVSGDHRSVVQPRSLEEESSSSSLDSLFSSMFGSLVATAMGLIASIEGLASSFASLRKVSGVSGAGLFQEESAKDSLESDPPKSFFSMINSGLPFV